MFIGYIFNQPAGQEFHPIRHLCHQLQSDVVNSFRIKGFQYFKKDRLLLEGPQSGYWVMGSVSNTTGSPQELILRFACPELGDGRLVTLHDSAEIEQKSFLRNRNSKNQYLDANMAFRSTLRSGVTKFLIFLNPLDSHYKTYNIRVDLLTPEFYD